GGGGGGGGAGGAPARGWGADTEGLGVASDARRVDPGDIPSAPQARRLDDAPPQAGRSADGSFAGDAVFAAPLAVPQNGTQLSPESEAQITELGHTARAHAAGTDVEPVDPDTWLAAALAELDRIWGTSPQAANGSGATAEATETARAETASGGMSAGGMSADDSTVGTAVPAVTGTTAADTTAGGKGVAGCVVVLDLSRAGERLPTEAAAPTVARVAQRLADRLPPSSRLREDGVGAVSVVLPGRDYAAASEWMHGVLPGLVDGLTVEPAAVGSLLRAAVHDVNGVVGAQILQRLDGARPGRGPAGQAAAPAPRHAAPTPDGPGDGPPGDVGPDRGTASARGPAGAGRGEAGTRATGQQQVPTGGRHDESVARPPYLPEGVVVRPGSGGRRHRRGPDSAGTDDVAPGPAPSPAPQSTEGLGLADLLAGALAAYRGI
ncbi:MAG: hypothetical protein L0H64_15065, partial [Pseudonocardia sp.]|nr:hypothetical protein [Pseudonocardia sp.]